MSNQLELIPNIVRDADFSLCRKYRYTLRRTWNLDKPSILFIMLNPSTADEFVDDPTNKRIVSFSKKWGFGSLVTCNLFAFRTPYPKKLKKEKYPVDEYPGQNNTWLRIESSKAKKIIAAWGNYGEYLNQDLAVEELLKDFELFSFGLTNTGQPKHPLYLPENTKLQKYRPTEDRRIINSRNKNGRLHN